MDRCAVGHDYVAVVDKHVSQKDYSAGFGGKYGVQSDRIDKVCLKYFLSDFKFKKDVLCHYYYYSFMRFEFFAL